MYTAGMWFFKTVLLGWFRLLTIYRLYHGWLTDKASHFPLRLSGLENGLLGLDSKVNAVVFAKSVAEVQHRDVICFGHLLFEMCTGYELLTPRPTPSNLNIDLERYPKVSTMNLSSKKTCDFPVRIGRWSAWSDFRISRQSLSHHWRPCTFRLIPECWVAWIEGSIEFGKKFIVISSSNQFYMRLFLSR